MSRNTDIVLLSWRSVIKLFLQRCTVSSYISIWFAVAHGMDLCGLFWTSGSMENMTVLTLKVVGLGHSLNFGLISNASVAELKRRIEQETKIPVEYQSLLAVGKKLEDGTLSLVEVGIEDRTKIILMYNQLYMKEKDVYDALLGLDDDIVDLASKKGTMKPIVIRELVTKICCKLDEVDVVGSETLRARRKALLKKAESLDDSPSE